MREKTEKWKNNGKKKNENLSSSLSLPSLMHITRTTHLLFLLHQHFQQVTSNGRERLQTAAKLMNSVDLPMTLAPLQRPWPASTEDPRVVAANDCERHELIYDSPMWFLQILWSLAREGRNLSRNLSNECTKLTSDLWTLTSLGRLHRRFQYERYGTQSSSPMTESQKIYEGLSRHPWANSADRKCTDEKWFRTFRI